MTNSYLLTIVLGMSVVTALPRVIPAFFPSKIQLPGWVDKWLRVIPFAALGALIFPGVLGVEQQDPRVGLLGAITAVILTLFRLQIIYIIFGSIGTVILARIILLG